MSNLQQSINARRASESAALACASVGEQTSGLVIATWQGESWVLPWSYLISVRWDGPEGQEKLSFAFSGHAVVVHGRNLRPLLADIARFRLGCIRALPADYQAKFPDDAPFISRIEVSALSPLGGP
jgi:hypothetical protein